MNNRLILIVIISLCIFSICNKVEAKSISFNNQNISESALLKYVPGENSAFFISNTNSSEIKKYIKQISKKEDQEKIKFLGTTLLSFLGLDLGENKLEDIYNNEIAISTYNNKENNKKDLFIIFKIREDKYIDDILNINNETYQQNKIIEIERENKISYLKYIYQTEDNYIIISSNKELIEKAIDINNLNINKRYSNYILSNHIEEEKSILFIKYPEIYELLENKNYYGDISDEILMTFTLKDKNITVRSYLINNYFNISNYNNEDSSINKDIYNISLYNNINNFLNYLKIDIRDDIENNILEELNQTIKNNILILISDKEWIIGVDKNTKENLLNNIQSLKDFNRYKLEKNENFYSIFSKHMLSNEKNIIQEVNFNNVFAAENKKFLFISNNLINEDNINQLSKQFTRFQNSNDTHILYNNEIYLSNYFPENLIQNLSFFKYMNYFLRDIINISFLDFRAKIKQSIPEKYPIIYTESNVKLF